RNLCAVSTGARTVSSRRVGAAGTLDRIGLDPRKKVGQLARVGRCLRGIALSQNELHVPLKLKALEVHFVIEFVVTPGMLDGALRTRDRRRFTADLADIAETNRSSNGVSGNVVAFVLLVSSSGGERLGLPLMVCRGGRFSFGHTHERS